MRLDSRHFAIDDLARPSAVAADLLHLEIDRHQDQVEQDAEDDERPALARNAREDALEDQVVELHQRLQQQRVEEAAYRHFRISSSWPAATDPAVPKLWTTSLRTAAILSRPVLREGRVDERGQLPIAAGGTGTMTSLQRSRRRLLPPKSWPSIPPRPIS